MTTYFLPLQIVWNYSFEEVVITALQIAHQRIRIHAFTFWTSLLSNWGLVSRHFNIYILVHSYGEIVSSIASETTTCTLMNSQWKRECRLYAWHKSLTKPSIDFRRDLTWRIFFFFRYFQPNKRNLCSIETFQKFV